MTPSTTVVPQERAVVVDGARPIAAFEGENAAAVAVQYVDALPEVETGRYGIDVSTLCAACAEFHSPEADCA